VSSDTTSVSWDTLIASTLVLCALLGAPANLLALRYFWGTRRRDLSTLLYIAICIMDTCTCVAHVPVTCSLFLARDQGLFGNMAVCSSWTIVFKFLQKMSMFLVMLMSVSRTIVIARPFYRVRKVRVIVAFVAYSGFLLVHDGVEMTCAKFKYSSDGPFCYTSKDLSCAPYATAMITIEAGLPPIITFFSFIVCTTTLAKSGPKCSQLTLREQQSYLANPPSGLQRAAQKRIGRGKQNKQKQASTTITIFTAIFLFCNLPYFIIMVLYTTTYSLSWPYPGAFFSSYFMYWYSWPIAKIVCTVLNATLNPLLYYCRITKFNEWCGSVVRGQFPVKPEESQLVSNTAI